MSRTTLLHAAACLIVVYLFGGQILSLSIDVPHHFAVVDELMKHGEAYLHTAPNIGPMADYPRMGHWIAAAAGHLVRSGLLGLWLVAILSVYTTYFGLAAIASDDGRFLSSVIFGALSLALVFTHGIIGFEIVGNFFYSQLVGMAVAVMAFVAALRLTSPFARVAVTVTGAAFVATIHALPAFFMLATLMTAMALKIVIVGWTQRRLDRMEFAGLAVLVLLAGALLVLHPSVQAMRHIAKNDGTISFPVSAAMFAALAGVAIASQASLIVWSMWRGRVPPEADLMVFAGLLASAALTGLQALALILFDEGSFYAVMKYVFVLSTFSVLAVARVVAALVPTALTPALPRWVMVCISALVAVGVTTGVLNRPGPAIHPIAVALERAEHAVKYAFPAFKPGNTLYVAESEHPVVRYMISVSTFGMPLAGAAAVSLISGPSFPEKVADYVMIERSRIAGRACPHRHAENAMTVIVPVSCLNAAIEMPEAGKIVFSGNPGAQTYLREGWWPIESWGVWSQGTSRLTFGVPASLRGQALDLVILTNLFVADRKPAQTIDFRINGIDVGAWRFSAPSSTLTMQIPSELAAAESLTIELKSQDAIAPSSIGFNGDNRVLGLGLVSVQLRRR